MARRINRAEKGAAFPLEAWVMGSTPDRYNPPQTSGVAVSAIASARWPGHLRYPEANLTRISCSFTIASVSSLQ